MKHGVKNAGSFLRALEARSNLRALQVPSLRSMKMIRKRPVAATVIFVLMGAAVAFGLEIEREKGHAREAASKASTIAQSTRFRLIPRTLR